MIFCYFLHTNLLCSIYRLSYYWLHKDNMGLTLNLGHVFLFINFSYHNSAHCIQPYSAFSNFKYSVLFPFTITIYSSCFGFVSQMISTVSPCKDILTWSFISATNYAPVRFNVAISIPYLPCMMRDNNKLSNCTVGDATYSLDIYALFFSCLYMPYP